MRLGVLVCMAVAIAGCATTGSRALPYYQQTQVDVGISRTNDAVSYAGGATASGTALRLSEVNGAITKSLLTSAALFLMELSEGASRSTTDSEYQTSERAKGWVCRPGGKDCIATGWESVTTRQVKVTVKPRTPEEQATHEANLRSTAGILAVIPMHTDVAYYPQRDNGEIWGYSVSSYFIALPVTRFFELATGYYFQRLSARLVDEDTGMEVAYKHRARGIPFRITAQPVGWFAAYAEVFLNQLAFDDGATGERTHSARISGSIALPWMQRIYARFGVERNRLGRDDGGWGTLVEIGARF